MQTPEQFDAIVLRTNPDGSTVKLKDVAECKIGTENYDIEARYKGKPIGGMASDSRPAPTPSTPLIGSRPRWLSWKNSFPKG